MKNRTVNMFAETCEDLPIFSGMETTQACEFPMPGEWSDDGLDALVDGCTIHIVPVEGWTVGPSDRYRIQVDGAIKGYREYAHGLRTAQQLALHYVNVITYYESNHA